jgi:hypothetical protein
MIAPWKEAKARATGLEPWACYLCAASLSVGKRVLIVGEVTDYAVAYLRQAGATEVIRVRDGSLKGPGTFDVILLVGDLDQDRSQGSLLQEYRDCLDEDGVLVFWASGVDPTWELERWYATWTVVPIYRSPGDEWVQVGTGEGPADCLVVLCSLGRRELHMSGKVVPMRHVLEHLTGLFSSAVHEASDWRKVAQERDQALEELERVNHWLETRPPERIDASPELHRAMAQLKNEFEVLRARADVLEQQLHKRSQELALTQEVLAGIQSTLSWRVTKRLKKVIPPQSLPGRALRRTIRMAGKLLKRSA